MAAKLFYKIIEDLKLIKYRFEAISTKTFVRLTLGDN